ncbi:MAG: S8 family serine peptidase, partial [Verrucomicrobiota bacterium]
MLFIGLGLPGALPRHGTSFAADVASSDSDPAPFAHASTLDEETGLPDRTGSSTRRRLIQTDFKTPFLCVEEKIAIDAVSGREIIRNVKEFAADRLIVRLRRGMTRQQLEAVLEKNGARIRKALLAEDLYLVEWPTRDLDTVPRAMALLGKHPDLIAYAEPDYIVHATDTLPNDPSFNELYGLHNLGQAGGTPDADIDAVEAWDFTTGGSEIVGVIDTGVDVLHEDLAANMWVNPGEIPGDLIDNDLNGFVDDVYGWDFINEDNDPQDGNSHGTHVAGTVAAVGSNGVGVVGVSWSTRIMALKFLS